MALKRQHKSLAEFSMASMTDVIFLLLIFFMITSTFMSPSALEVNLPESSQTTTLKPGTRIYIDSAQQLFYTRYDTVARHESQLMPIQAEQLPTLLLGLKSQPEAQQFVAVHADEAVPYGKIVEVLDAGSKAGIKIVLATKPLSPDATSQDKASGQAEGQAESDIPWADEESFADPSQPSAPATTQPATTGK